MNHHEHDSKRIYYYYIECSIFYGCGKLTTRAYEKEQKAIDIWNTRPLEDKQFWEGFDACLEMVLNHIDNRTCDIGTDLLKDELIENAELYRKDG